MIFYYYKIHNRINNKLYIGITNRSIEKRFKEHLAMLSRNSHFNYQLQKDWNSYGKDNFEFSEIERKDFSSIEEGYNHEKELIDSFSKKILYNLAPGGRINPMYDESIKSKMITTKQ